MPCLYIYIDGDWCCYDTLKLQITRNHHPIKAYPDHPLQFPRADSYRVNHPFCPHCVDTTQTVDISCYKIKLSKLNPRHTLHLKWKIYPFCDFLPNVFVFPTNADLKKYIYVVIPLLSIAFDLLSHPQNLFYTNTILASHLNAIPPVCFFV